MTKKWTVLFLAAVLAVGLSACDTSRTEAPRGQAAIHGVKPHQHHGPARDGLLHREAGVAEGTDGQRHAGDDQPGGKALPAAFTQKAKHPLHGKVHAARPGQKRPGRKGQVEDAVVGLRPGQEQRPRQQQIACAKPPHQPQKAPGARPAIGGGHGEGGGGYFICKGQRVGGFRGQQDKGRRGPHAAACQQPPGAAAHPAQKPCRQQKDQGQHKIGEQQHIQIDHSFHGGAPFR